MTIVYVMLTKILKLTSTRGIVFIEDIIDGTRTLRLAMGSNQTDVTATVPGARVIN